MAKYLIHVCNQRLWYVTKYLLPSMQNQGISIDDVQIYLDKNNEGCLQSFIKSIEDLPEEGNTWHLQDDVIICRNFKILTEKQYPTRLVCGFASKYDKNQSGGVFTGIDDIWYSFPCIRIDNALLKHFSIWFYSYIYKDIRFQMWLRSRKNDDLLFRYFLDCYYKEISATNILPNLVDHIDYLLGGSTVNKREERIRSNDFADTDLIQELKVCLVDGVDKKGIDG